MLHFSYAQNEGEIEQSQNIFYAEALGPGGFGSVNFERIVLSKGMFQTSVRLGLCLNRFKDFRDKFNPDIAIPLNVGIAYGNQFKGEVFLGTTYTNNVIVSMDLEPERTTAFHLFAGAGLRYQPYGKGLFARIGYSPLLEKFTQFRHWGYLSIGWMF